jgi:hypothetical protein
MAAEFLGTSKRRRAGCGKQQAKDTPGLSSTPVTCIVMAKEFLEISRRRRG